MTLHVRFWGTRGSIPSPGPQTVRYGGNTPCLEIRAGTEDGALTILDAGTGIRELGQRLTDPGNGALNGNIYLTHAHWDHIQGLPFFSPLFRGGDVFRIWTATELLDRIERAVKAQMSPEVFPVPFEEVRAALQFNPLETSGHLSNGVHVTPFPVRHPGGALGFRVAVGNGGGPALVYIPDNELAEQAAYETTPGWRDRLLGFVHRSAVLVHDAMYTLEEQAARQGWGHSSVDEAVQLALDAEVDRLVLFHHRPERSDDELDALVRHARSVAGGSQRLEIVAAAEGSCLKL